MILTYKPFLVILIIFLKIKRHVSAESEEKSFLDYFFKSCKCRCGVPNREARFFGGDFLRGHEFPWIALIQTQKDADPTKTQTVPGTLINNRYILTGATPLVGLTPYLVKVTLGAHNRCIPDVTSSNVSVEEILIHPDFSLENHANDIALLKLSTPVLLERRISPICLGMNGFSYLGQVGTIIGWSKDLEAALPSCRPRKLGLPILNPDECLRTISHPQLFTVDKGCIGLVGSNSIICEEDAGTPVMYRTQNGIYELMGILTSENKCAPTEKNLGLYTRVTKHLSWIVHNTRDACYCIKT